MKSRSKTSKAISPKPLQNGQVWQIDDSNLHIELVGKRLVHYKLFKGTAKRAPVSLSGVDALNRFLRQNNGVLIQESP